MQYNKMKTKYSFIMTALVLLLAGCEKPVEITRDSLRLTAPEGLIDMSALTEADEQSVAATFKWTEATPIGSDYTFTYLFQLDMDNHGLFTTAAPAIEIPAGQDSIDLTVGYFYDNVVERWGKKAKERVKLEARIVAKVNGPTFEYPEIATAQLEVATFQPPSKPLYIMGTALGLDVNTAEMMEETSNGRKYSWSGDLLAGNLKFIDVLGQDYPGYYRDPIEIAGQPQDSFMVYHETAPVDGEAQLFEVPKAGLYTIELSKRDLKVYINQMSDERLYIVGDAVVGSEWDPNKHIVMTPNPKNIKQFCAKITLNADGQGEDAFKILTEPNWEAPAYRPTVANGSIEDTAVMLSAGDPDNKWKVTSDQNGDYEVTLDTEAMTIEFKKVQ